MSLIQRVRDSGKCPPTLLSDDRVVTEDGFDDAAMQVLSPEGLALSSDPKVVDSFSYLLQTTSSLDSTPGDDKEKKKGVLEQRRTILLAIVSGTPSSSPTLTSVLNNGFLKSVKVWLDEVLAKTVGSIDFLLHLLSSIAHLPVTKSTIKSSGMGKVIGTIEKHSICKDTPNEAAISGRVQEIKEAWNKSVKAHKAAEASSDSTSNSANKRTSEDASLSPSATKRVKRDPDAKKTSSFSSLLKKVIGPPKPGSTASSETGTSSTPVKKSTTKKSSSKRVKWSDHFGGALTASTLIDGEMTAEEAHHDNSVTWSDRKKRDRLREKELLAKAKKSKLVDDDEDELDMLKVMKATSEWRTPSLLPPLPDVSPANLVSTEIESQNERQKSVLEVKYSSDYEVPASPAPLSDIEQALDMTSQSSAVVGQVPFFTSEAAAPAPEAAPSPTPAFSTTPAVPSYPPPPPQSTPATQELVQSLGLPMYLVGQDSKALQTLAHSPGLLATLVDATGAYDQGRLMGLVQTLSVTNGGQAQQAPPAYPPSNGAYGAPAPAPAYGQPSSFLTGPPRYGKSEGNLHISGYGPTTTQADIIALFSPYVRVEDVVMKGTFSFVNTSDPPSAQRAREALSGTLLGGMPIRINAAQRKSRDANSSYQPSSTGSYGAASTYGGGGISGAGTYGGGGNNTGSSSYGSGGGSGPSSYGSTNGGNSNPYGGGAGTMGSSFGGPQQMPGMPPMQTGAQVSIDSVRDDRGNPATKNLFVAGYGQGTAEQQIRDLFSQHANVIGVVSKGSFTFVNTSDRAMAVQARNMLGGTTLNGGVLRINFAKETGRLGTSFDLTYGKNTGPNAVRGGPPQPNTSYYGRGGY